MKRYTKLLPVLLLLCLLTLVSSCGGGSKPDVAVTKITLTSLDLIVGETRAVTVTIIPEDATDKSLTWTSSDPAVATVADGTVTAVAKGETTITATNTKSGVSATCTVRVLSGGSASADDVTGEVL